MPLDADRSWTREKVLPNADIVAMIDAVYPLEPEHRVLARLLLAEHKPAAAVELLERWRALAVAQGRTVSVLRLRVLEALAHEAAGNPAAALTALVAALVLAAPEGYLRVFLDEGPPVAALLRELMVCRRLEQLGRGSVPQEFLTRLTAAALRVLDDPAAHQPLGQAARQLMESRYSLDVAVPALRDFFEKQSASQGGRS